jgi:hypothetical protein
MPTVHVWERPIVTVEAVLLVDDAGTVQGRWSPTGARALHLYDALVLAGAPLTSVPGQAWTIGRPEWIELLVAVTGGQVLTVHGDKATVPLGRRLTDRVLDFYRRYLDDTES